MLAHREFDSGYMELRLLPFQSNLFLIKLMIYDVSDREIIQSTNYHIPLKVLTDCNQLELSVPYRLTGSSVENCMC